ncbi:MAG: integrin alpha [Myxococcota bacterium]
MKRTLAHLFVLATIACGTSSPSKEGGDGRDLDADTAAPGVTGSSDDCGTVATLYADADGDGYGDQGASAEVCPGTDGMVADATDCDDTDAAIHPGADDPVDGIDQDCGGEAEGFALADVATAKIIGERSHDVLGTSVAGGADMDDDGDDDVAVGAPGVDDPHRETGGECGGHAGVVYVFASPLSGEVPATEAEGYLYGRGDEDYFGGSLAWVEDLDGDYRAELLVGASGYMDWDGGAGATYLFAGPPVGTLTPDDAVLEIVGNTPRQQVGTHVANAGDVDGDGVRDLALAARGWQPGGAALWVSADHEGVLDASDAEGIFLAPAGAEAWRVEGPGDVDGDGYDDLLVGAPMESSMGEVAGAVYLVRGPALGELGLGEAEAVLLGEGPRAELGYDVSALGDIDRDGRADIAVTSGESDDWNGSVWLVHGPVTGTSVVNEVSSVRLRGGAGAALGLDLAPAGDLGWDDVPDLFAGATTGTDPNGTSVGNVHVIPGDAAGEHDVTSQSLSLWGEHHGQYAGSALSTGGDVDDDGASDLLVGAVGDETEGFNAGAAYVISGAALGW